VIAGVPLASGTAKGARRDSSTMVNERLDRQLRIEGWDQRCLDRARVGVVGDADRLASLFVLSASALGLNDLTVIAPALDRGLLEAARRVNRSCVVTWIDGLYTHPALRDLLTGCRAIVDLTQYGLANKLLLAKAFVDGVPIVRGRVHADGDFQGVRVFAYAKGREWQELEQIVSSTQLPGAHNDDAVLDIIGAGLALEETKNLLMGHSVSDDVIAYDRRAPGQPPQEPRICVVGAGALGNFVGLGLAYAGLRDITFMDPDVVEMTNLNRQVLLYDAIGRPKAATLAARLNAMTGVDAKGLVTYFRRSTDISAYDVVFDCVDNFETRVALSEACKETGTLLVSGGANASAGQVVVYDPRRGGETPAELLGLYAIVDRRSAETYRRDRASCMNRADPAVVMTSQIVAGLMVDAYRTAASGQVPSTRFYGATGGARISGEDLQRSPGRAGDGGEGRDRTTWRPVPRP